MVKILIMLIFNLLFYFIKPKTKTNNQKPKTKTRTTIIQGSDACHVLTGLANSACKIVEKVVEGIGYVYVIKK